MICRGNPLFVVGVPLLSLLGVVHSQQVGYNIHQLYQQRQGQGSGSSYGGGQGGGQGGGSSYGGGQTNPPLPSYQPPQATQAPYPQQTQAPYPQPTQAPYPQPTQGPYPQPQPTQAPYPQPTQGPFPQPTQGPYPQPTQAPYPQPTQAPYPQPTQQPYPQPTGAPYPQPTQPSYTQPQPTASPYGRQQPNTGYTGGGQPQTVNPYGQPPQPTGGTRTGYNSQIQVPQTGTRGGTATGFSYNTGGGTDPEPQPRPNVQQPVYNTGRHGSTGVQTFTGNKYQNQQQTGYQQQQQSANLLAQSYQISQSGYGTQTQTGYGGQTQTGTQTGYGGQTNTGTQTGYGGQTQTGHGGQTQTGYGGQTGQGGQTQTGYGGQTQTGHGGQTQTGYGGQTGHGGQTLTGYGGQTGHGGQTQTGYGGGTNQARYGAGQTQTGYGGQIRPGGQTGTGGYGQTGGQTGTGGYGQTGGQTGTGGYGQTGGQTGTGGYGQTGGQTGTGGYGQTGGQTGTGGYGQTGGQTGTGGYGQTGGGGADTSDPCFRRYRNCIIVNAQPFERRSTIDIDACKSACLGAQSGVYQCKAFVFDTVNRVCDLFAHRGNQPPSRLMAFPGRDYYETTGVTTGCSGGGGTTGGYGTGGTTGGGTGTTTGGTGSTATTPSTGTGPTCDANQETHYLRIEGFELSENDDVTITGQSEQQCIDICTNNKGSDGTNAPCKSFDYVNGNCVITEAAAVPSGNGQLEQRDGTSYYEKICIDSTSAAGCPKVFDRFPQMILVGFAETVVDAADFEECMNNCLNAQSLYGFSCRSGMFYFEEPQLNCILNTEDRNSQPDLFTQENNDVVDYFETGCSNRRRRFRGRTTVKNSLRRRRLHGRGRGAVVSNVESEIKESARFIDDDRSNSSSVVRIVGDQRGRPAFGEWTEWSPCDRSKDGRRARYRRCRKANLKGCPTETEWCNRASNPKNVLSIDALQYAKNVTTAADGKQFQCPPDVCCPIFGGCRIGLEQSSEDQQIRWCTNPCQKNSQ